MTIANQWNFANGRWSNGSDYGLVDAESLERTPAFEAGGGLLMMDVLFDANDREPRLYGGRSADGAVQLLVVNPSDVPATRSITVEPSTGADANRHRRRRAGRRTRLSGRQLQRRDDTERRAR